MTVIYLLYIWTENIGKIAYEEIAKSKTLA